ncbi:MAG: response regulator [Saprospiraceae bacterium]
MDSRKNILVVEDHKSIRLLLGNLLGKDYTVTTKADGFAGMAWLTNGNIPDLIVLDMSMPRLNGLEFLRSIRNSGFYHRIPVIVLSGNDDEKDVAQCDKMGVAQYLTKPFNPINLRKNISEILAATETAAAY